MLFPSVYTDCKKSVLGSVARPTISLMDVNTFLRTASFSDAFEDKVKEIPLCLDSLRGASDLRGLNPRENIA